MYCVKSLCTVEDIIKKSRFIGVIVPCKQEEDIQTHLKQLHAKHPNATHIAYAYRIRTSQGLLCRFNDAGEPSGTAGKPIFQHLEGKDLVDVLLAVIRYFGGIKLGAGGLTRAYGNAAKRVIEDAVIEPFIERTTVRLAAKYSEIQALEYLIKKLNGRIIDHQFAEQISLLIEIPLEELPLLQRTFPMLEKE